MTGTANPETQQPRPAFAPVGVAASVSNGTPFPTRRATAPAGDDSRLLEEASRIADTVRNRFSELERREQQITEQLSAFDQEQRRFRLMQQQYHDELVDRDAELKRREQKFGERLTHGQQVLAQLQAREQELERLTGGLEQQRANLRAEIGQELEVERAALKHSKSLVDAERQELSDQAEKMRNEHQITMRQFRRDLEGERRRLRSQLASDIETEQQTFESQRAEWKQARETAEAELQREREAHKEAVRRVELELAEGRDRSIQEVEAARAKLEAERRDLEHGLEAERGALRQAREEVERAAIDQKATLAERRAALDAEAEKDRETALAEVRRSWDEERSQLARELAGDIGAKKQQLAAEIAEFEARQSREMTALEEIRETQEATLRQARSELVEYKRQAEEQRAEDLAAHHAHLTAARGQFEIELQNRLGAREEELRQQIAEFEGQKRKHHEAVEQATQALVTERDAIGREQAAWQQSRGQEEERLADQRRQTHVSQHALDVHRQQFRAESIRRQETLERRLQQLGRFREVLTQREESIERERQVLMQSREQFSSELEVDRQSLVEQAADIERQRNELAADTQHQTQQLDRERQKLQERSECLDQLRRELEQVSVQNLEFRLAAQEALAELTSQVGSQTAEQRVAAVRPVIAGQIRELHDVTGESSTARMVAIAQRQVEEQTSQLKEERTTFARRMNEREQELHEQESRLENRLHDWEQRESRWRHMRDDWLNEKLNAEQIIRSLLDELSVA